jgi:hypothetical protein
VAQNQNAQDNRPNADRQNDKGAPSWRKEIPEPREEAQRAIEAQGQNVGNNKRRKNKNKQGNANQRPNQQNQGAPNNQSWQAYQQERLEKQQEILKANLGKSQVIVQNVGETRELAKLAIVLDQRFAFIRANMFVRLPGEYGMLALYDLQEALNGLKGVENRLGIFGVKKYAKGKNKNNDRPTLNPETLKRFHYAKLKAFVEQGEKLIESLRALGYEGDTIAGTLKDALADYEAKRQAEVDRINAERKAEQEEKARAKAERTAAYEAEQAKRKANALGDQGEGNANASETGNADIPSLTADQTEAEQETKPTKTKKEKAA